MVCVVYDVTNEDTIDKVVTFSLFQAVEYRVIILKLADAFIDMSFYGVLFFRSKLNGYL